MIHVLSIASTKELIGDYRVRLPAQAVTAAGIGITVEATDRLDVDAVKVNDGVEIKNVFIPGGIDVVSFQRPYRSGISSVIAWLRTNRPDIGIVVDIDDQMQTPPTIEYLKRSAALADAVTVTTPVLKKNYGYDASRTFVIRNAVAPNVLRNPSKALVRKRRTTEETPEKMLGCSGSSINDLAEMYGGLSKCVSPSTRFRRIGLNEDISEALDIPKRFIETSGKLPANLHHVALGEIDLAVIPVSNFETGSTTALEFAAAGVPIVATRTSEHAELAAQGMPIRLVNNRKKEWRDAVHEILSMNYKDFRSLATAHRENIRAHHTVDRRALDWAAAYRTAYNLVRNS